MKQKEKREKKPLKVIRLVTIFVLCLLLSGAIFACAFIGVVATSVNRDSDMEVMEMMRGSRTTRFYLPDHSVERWELTTDNYMPVEADILYGNENLVWADESELPKLLKQAFISIEDRDFYHHGGVEWARTLYAACNHIFRFRPRFGGSTITQQLVKNVHGDRDISVVRKVKEIIRALRLEREYSKEEILTYYLNIVPLGHGCVGVKSASRYYFNKEPSELSAAECATLAAITNAPSKYDPVKAPKLCGTRRDLVLREMTANGYISEAVYETSVSSAVSLDITDPIYSDNGHNWYIETVISDVIADLMSEYRISEGTAKAMLYRGGLEIYTLMDPTVQTEMEKCFQNNSWLTGSDGKQIEAGMVVSDPMSGDILGIVGGSGEKQGTRLFNRAVDGYYPPGSALKPIAVYGPAIEWNKAHYGTAFDDIPFETTGGYQPHNSPNIYAGRIPLHEALAKSKNTVAVKLLETLGIDRVYHHLKHTLNFKGLIDEGAVSDRALAPLALGQLSYGTTVREMADAYGSFASGGVLHQGRTYLAVYDAKGTPLLTKQRHARRIWSEQTAYIMTRMMSEVTEYGTARGITLKEVVDVAGKTGTSSADKDKWFAGYTPYYVAVLHCAYDDRTPLPAAERCHLRVWDQVMQGLHENVIEAGGEPTSFAVPDGIAEVVYCRDSGCIPTEACEHELRGNRSELGYFKTDYLPQELCLSHTEAYYDVLRDRYGKGHSQGEGCVYFYVLTVPGRIYSTDDIPQDMPYTLEYLSHENQTQPPSNDGDTMPANTPSKCLRKNVIDL